jgi:DNA-3-methyladenine glycosylase II
MHAEIHQKFLEIAGSISLDLQSAFLEIGPIAFPNRKERGLAFFLARAVVGQQISMGAASSIWKRIEDEVAKNRSRIPDFFQDENRLLLQKCGVSSNKAKSLMSIRHAEAEGLLALQTLDEMDAKTKSTHLQQIWGVGQWTADMALIFFFQEPDIWPKGDISVQKIFRQYVDEGNAAPDSNTVELFAPYRSYLALYMWQIVDGDV